MLRDACEILPGTVLPPNTIVPPLTVFGGVPGVLLFLVFIEC